MSSPFVTLSNNNLCPIDANFNALFGKKWTFLAKSYKQKIINVKQ